MGDEQHESSNEIPNPSKQLEIIKETLDKSKFEKGAIWYLLDCKWYRAWKDFGKNRTESSPEFINNTTLLVDSRAYRKRTNSKGAASAPVDKKGINEEDFLHIRMTLQENDDFIIISEKCWSLLHSWYGGGPALPRRVIEEGDSKKSLRVEIFPVVLSGQIISEKIYFKEGIPKPTQTASGQLVPLPLNVDQIFAQTSHSNDSYSGDVTQDEGSSQETNSTQKKSNQETEDLTTLDIELVVSKKATIVQIKERLKQSFLNCDVSKFRIWNLYDEKLPKLIEDENDTLEDAIIVHKQKILIEVQLATGTWPKDEKATLKPGNELNKSKEQKRTVSQRLFNFLSGSSISNGSSSPQESPSRGSRVPGVCGLDNLGNTCFMNSALQCLSNTPLLTEYFLSEKYKREINKNNPLGMKGRIAEEYGSLLKQIWSGSHSSVAPKNFKLTLGKFAPQFSGYSQHDSQELLAFLLDGLHEDLNRVKEKPSVPVREANGQPDELVAKEAWEDHLKRNKSVIVDLFQGQLKSRLICPKCNHVSITFDPFMYLSLPLPAQNERLIELTFVKNDENGWEFPVRYLIRSKKGDTVEQLKNLLQVKTGVRAEDMVFADVYQHRIYKLLANTTSVAAIRLTDVSFAYQVSAPKDDHMRIQIVHRKDKKKGVLSSTPPELLGIPMLISIKEQKKPTGKEFYQLLWKRAKPFLKNWEKIIELDSEGFPKKYPYTLHYVTTSGTSCAKCESSEECTGCLVELDNNPVKLKNGNSICISWDSKILKNNFDKNFADTIKFDASMNDNKKENSSKETTLQDCLDLFIQDEQLGPNDAWYCPKCKEFQQANKKFDLWKLPQVLVIHLKRFSYSRSTREKLTSLISFPLEGLGLSSFLINEEEQRKSSQYDLVAVSNHTGGLGGGHYTTYAKSRDDKWIHFNDSSASQIDDSSKVVSPLAYVLVYQRKPNSRP